MRRSNADCLLRFRRRLGGVLDGRAAGHGRRCPWPLVEPQRHFHGAGSAARSTWQRSGSCVRRFSQSERHGDGTNGRHALVGRTRAGCAGGSCTTGGTNGRQRWNVYSLRGTATYGGGSRPRRGYNHGPGRRHRDVRQGSLMRRRHMLVARDGNRPQRRLRRRATPPSRATATAGSAASMSSAPMAEPGHATATALVPAATAPTAAPSPGPMETPGPTAAPRLPTDLTSSTYRHKSRRLGGAGSVSNPRN